MTHTPAVNSFLDERTIALSGAPVRTDARYVLYWMQIYKRTTHNHALNKAIEVANSLKLPLVVYEGLKYYYPWANDRLHTFILQGVAEKKSAFEAMGIRYVFYLQQDEHAPKNTVAKLAEDAAVLITEQFPCFIIPAHNRHITERVHIPVIAVDGNGLIPLSQLPKEEFAARTIRPKINRLLPQYLNELHTPLLHIRKPALEVNCPETVVDDAGIARLVAGCAIDHSVAPSLVYHGGETAAKKRLRHFVANILPDYDALRNKPDIDGTSRLSSYLHFGFLSPHQIYAVVARADAPEGARNTYLEELVVRRELSYNFTNHNKDYASLDSLPQWAMRTMEKHANDQRRVLYSAAQLEAGETGDALWNATQQELVKTGEIHNYMRMLWGKKIIEWSATYEEAFRIMEHLNNKYALDGRNPNSYAGILWCFGKHDRAWGPERPIFGTLRYLSSDSWKRKVNAKAYIARYGN